VLRCAGVVGGADGRGSKPLADRFWKIAAPEGSTLGIVRACEKNGARGTHLKWLPILSVFFLSCQFGSTGIDLVSLGIEAQQKGDLEKAINTYTRAIESGELSNVDLVRAYNLRGEVQVGKSRFEEALTDFESAIRLDRNYATSYYNRALLVYGDAAIADLSRALKPDYVDALFERGIRYDRNGDQARAFLDLDTVIRLNPRHVDAYSYRGGMYHLKAEYDKAITDFDSAIREDPKNDILLTFRGGGYYGKQMFNEASADFEAALKLNPGNSVALSSRGMVKAAQRDYRGAIADFDQALHLVNGDDAEAALIMVERGRAYKQEGNFEKAIDDLSNAIRLQPNLGEAFRVRGNTLSQMGQHARAVRDLDSAVQVSPENYQAFYNRGVEHFYLGRFEAAAADLAHAVNIKPSHAFASVWLYLARARLKKSGIRQLSENARRIEVTPWTRNIVNLYLGKIKSDALLRAASDPDPQTTRERLCEAYFYLGQQALLNGKAKEAARLFKASIDTGVTQFVEHRGAQVELTRLTK
jgi:lipoprotein NlpI